ncbi:MAG: hypothetical protein ACK2U9_25735, partial [Anaerolineae bacterium]
MAADQSTAQNAGAPGESGDAGTRRDDSLGELRQILLGQDQERIAELGLEIDDLRRLLADEEALAAMIAPSLDEALRNKIRQNRDEMIEVLPLLWSGTDVDYHGAQVDLPMLRMRPAAGHVPILIGGNTKPALRRAA